MGVVDVQSRADAVRVRMMLPLQRHALAGVCKDAARDLSGLLRTDQVRVADPMVYARRMTSAFKPVAYDPGGVPT
jgi:hypothetical protein